MNEVLVWHLAMLLTAAICVVGYLIYRQRRVPKHQHTPELLRVTHLRWVEDLRYADTGAGTPHTRCYWRCTECGHLWTTRIKGHWAKEEVQG